MSLIFKMYAANLFYLLKHNYRQVNSVNSVMDLKIKMIIIYMEITVIL